MSTRGNAAAAAALALAMALLAGCAQQGSGSAASASGTAVVSDTVSASASASSGSDASSAASAAGSQTVSAPTTLASLMEGRYASFGTFDQGVREGSGVRSLRLIINGEVDGYTHDATAIATAWEGLAGLQLAGEQPSGEESTLAIALCFYSEQDGVVFSFADDSHVDLGDGKLYALANPAGLSDILAQVRTAVEREMPKPGDLAPEENGAYLWDANGDNRLEHVWFDFVGNGDEARSVMSIRVFNSDGSLDVSGSLEGAYEISNVRIGEDEQGSFLSFDYAYGDSDSHDAIRHGILRIVDGALVTSEAA